MTREIFPAGADYLYNRTRKELLAREGAIIVEGETISVGPGGVYTGVVETDDSFFGGDSGIEVATAVAVMEPPVNTLSEPRCLDNKFEGKDYLKAGAWIGCGSLLVVAGSLAVYGGITLLEKIFSP